MPAVQTPAPEQDVQESSGGNTIEAATNAFESLLADGDAGEETAEDAEHKPTEPEADADEAEAEGEEGDADENEAEEEADGQPAQTYTVKIDGEEMQVTLDEALKGYQRHESFTRKTQQLARERDEHAAEFEAVKAERATYSRLLGALDARLRNLSPEPDWATLRQTDPMEYAIKFAEHQQAQQERSILAAEQQRLAHIQALDDSRALEAKVKTEAEKLPTLIPAWKDQAKMKAEMKAIVEHGISEWGYTMEDMAGLVDARLVNLLHKAYRYDQAAKKIKSGKALPTPAGSTPRTLNPATASPKQVTEVTRLKQRLAKTGKPKDAAAVFETML